MSYGLKYQSDFYNFFKKLVSVKIYKKDEATHTPPIMVRTAGVMIEVNYQDENTPIIGTGVKINIINEGTFESLEDLLVSNEKEFFCTVEYEGEGIVFQGYSLCDLNEQQFLPWSNISLQFTDYLRRLEKNYSALFADPTLNSCLITIIGSSLRLITGTAAPIPLYVNSTLFETTMSDGVTDTMLEQLWVENNAFYISGLSYDALNKIIVHNYDNTYNILNKVLLSLGAFLYSNGDVWILERQEDVMRTGNWVLLLIYPSSLAPSSEPNLKQEYNKQDGDFEYIESTQIIEYVSGLQKLELDLKDKPLDSLVFNDFPSLTFTPISTIVPVAGTLTLRNWYYYQDVTIAQKGYDYHGIGSFVRWTLPPSIDLHQNSVYEGLYYPFQIAFNPSEDKPTALSISYNTCGGTNMVQWWDDHYNNLQVWIRMAILIDGGAQSGKYLGLNREDGDKIWITDDIDKGSFIVKEDIAPVNRFWSFNQELDLTDPYDNIWNSLGHPTTQKFILCFFCLEYHHDADFFHWFDAGHDVEYNNYIGDISVTVTQEPVLNKLTYSISEDFMNTEVVDIDFFDLENVNYNNGYLTGPTYDDLTKTKLWTSEQSDDQQPLMDILARDRFRRYCRTIHKLKGKILYDGHLKPLSVLTDDNLMFDSENAIKLLLQGYSWDLNNGTYDIEAVEYTEEEILIDESNELPVIPTGLWINQPEAGEHMVVNWSAAARATGYTLQRMPWSYNPGYNNNSFITVYTGANITFNDDMQNELAYGLLPSWYTVYYKVSAYNANGASLYSTIVSGSWYK